MPSPKASILVTQLCICTPTKWGCVVRDEVVAQRRNICTINSRQHAPAHTISRRVHPHPSSFSNSRGALLPGPSVKFCLANKGPSKYFVSVLSMRWNAIHDSAIRPTSQLWCICGEE